MSIKTFPSIKNALSAARISTYEAVTASNDPKALELYAWNAQVSGALLTPLHICEVVIRNAVSDALEALYGARWPWSPAFERSLPAPTVGYSQRNDLINTRNKIAYSGVATTGKVIPELNFVFWEKMFTSRNDARLWDVHLRTLFPNLDPTKTIKDLRLGIYTDLNTIRILRNRIAHHEPIFTRNLIEDFSRIESLINYRCSITATWMAANQSAKSLIANPP